MATHFVLRRIGNPCEKLAGRPALQLCNLVAPPRPIRLFAQRRDSMPRFGATAGPCQKKDMSEMIEVAIKSRLDWGPNLMTLTLDQPADFAAGQFFNLALKVGDEVIRRSYSAASAPGHPLEFFLSRVDDGGFTPNMFEKGPGEKLLLSPKALGFFTLAEVPPTKRLWLVATGTGLGPYLAMIRSGQLLDRFEEIILVHGVREPYQLAYAQELTDMTHSPRYRYVPILSGDGQHQDEVLRGRITKAWDDGTLEGAAGPFDADCHMLLCGNPKMIEDMVLRLKDRGFEKHRRRKPGHFNFEKYW